jgi:hypothetical protein
VGTHSSALIVDIAGVTGTVDVADAGGAVGFRRL